MFTTIKHAILPVALCLALALAVPVRADELELQRLEALHQTTLNLIKALVAQGVLTQDKADEIIRQASVPAGAGGGAAAAAGAAGSVAGAAAAGASSAAEATSGASVAGAAKPTVRVPYVPAFVLKDMREQIKTEVLEQAKAERWADPARLPEWLDRISFGGEITTRFQEDIFRKPCDQVNGVTTSCNIAPADYVANFAPWQSLASTNTNENRQRLRVRALESATVKVNDKVTAEFRLSTGSLNNPDSNFQTLGNNFTAPGIGLDRGNIRYQPTGWLGLQLGRFGNPFFGTDLLWYDRLGFEGAAITVNPRFNQRVGVFATVGAFPVQDIAPSSTTDVKPKWLFGGQIGAEIGSPEHVRVKTALGLYNFDHVEGMPNGDPNFNTNLTGLSVPTVSQGGNTRFPIITSLNYTSAGVLSTTNPANYVYGLASKFRVLDLTTEVELGRGRPDALHFTWLVDLARNIGFDQNEIAARTGRYYSNDPNSAGLLDPRVRAYGTRFTLGVPKLKVYRDWQAYVGYKYVQRDAVLDAFNDPDFHLGGTDAKGWLAGGGYAIGRDTWLSLKYLSSSAIDGPPLTIDVLQADFNVRF